MIFLLASRHHHEADKSVRDGDFSKATQALQRVDAKINFYNIEKTIHHESLPKRSFGELTDDQRQKNLFIHTESSDTEQLVNVNN